MFNVPDYRVRTLTDRSVNENGAFVVYWMISSRRVQWNFSLDMAIMWAQQLGKPLLILEALRSGHKWASDRFHNFVMDGMRDNRDALKDSGVLYLSLHRALSQRGERTPEGFVRKSMHCDYRPFPKLFSAQNDICSFITSNLPDGSGRFKWIVPTI